MLKSYEADVDGRILVPAESYKVYEVKLQYVGLFWMVDNNEAVNTENGVVNEFKLYI